jgi:plasmid stabilization system protein ParE
MREVRESIAEGLAAIERGEGTELMAETWREIEREADERIWQGLPPSLMSARNPRITLAPHARSDLRDILVFTEERWDKEQRVSYNTQLSAAFAQRAQFPDLGFPRPEYGPDIRSLGYRCAQGVPRHSLHPLCPVWIPSES